MFWDYIIVGAGSAGCALAYELVNAGRTVLIIEAGGSDFSPYIKIPAGVLRAGEVYDWGYKSEPDPTRNGTLEHWHRGKVIGGSSSINGTIYARAPTHDFDDLSAFCNGEGGWSSEQIIPLFKEMERSDQSGEFRGRGGPLHIRTVKSPHRLTKAFVNSAKEAGYRINNDYNDIEQEGVSLVQFTQKGRFRWSASDAFLKPIRGRKNLMILIRAQVDKIEMEKGRAKAVVYQHGGATERATARDIVLCAGSINSPKILMLSGIGNPDEVKQHGIEVEISSPSVGYNLREHQLLRLLYRSRVPTYSLTEGLLQKIHIATKFLLDGEGPISNIFEAIGFLKSSPTEKIPDLILYFVALGFLSMPGGDLQTAPFPSVMAYVANSYPLSAGRVRLKSGRSDDPPIIECRLLEAKEDVRKLISGIRTIRRIMSASPIADLIVDEITPGPNVRDDAALENYVRNHTDVSSHPVGTCRMGIDPTSVVTPDLKVRGTENLWIADASVLPHHMSCNLNAICLMIGKKLGKHLLTTGH